jgi:hypothetical protein
MRDGNGIDQERHWEDKHRPEQRFFRCPVPIEKSAATLRFSGTKVPVELHEASIDGFAVLVQQKHVSKLRLGPRWVLQSTNERSEVWPQWLYCAPDGHVQVGLRRLQDLTPPPKLSWRPTLGRSRQREGDPTLLFAAFILLIVLAVSLPGLGDLLGSAAWIEQTLIEIFRSASALLMA